MIDTIRSTSPDTSGFPVHRWVRQEKRLLMGIFNIKSLKDKYTRGSAEEITDSSKAPETTATTAPASAPSIAEGVRSLIQNNPDLAGKNRRGAAQRSMVPSGSLREVMGEYEAHSPAEVAAQTPLPKASEPSHAEEISEDGTVTIDAQPLNLTETSGTAADILPLDEPSAEGSSSRSVHVEEHHAPTVASGVLADTAEEPAPTALAAREETASAPQGERERTPLFKLSPGTFTRSGAHDTDGPFQALFVCTGNIARSASGEVISKHLATEYGLEDKWTFASAGTGALVGQGVYELIANELIERGYNPEGFASRQLTEEIIKNATIILVAEKVHADWIVREWPQYHSKIVLLKQAARLREEARRAEPLSYLYSYGGTPLASDKLEDPYRRGPAAAKKAVDEIEESLRVILPWLARAHR